MQMETTVLVHLQMNCGFCLMYYSWTAVKGSEWKLADMLSLNEQVTRFAVHEQQQLVECPTTLPPINSKTHHTVWSEFDHGKWMEDHKTRMQGIAVN